MLTIAYTDLQYNRFRLAFALWRMKTPNKTKNEDVYQEEK